MEGKQKISELRDSLDKTLASHGVASKESVKKLVQNQLQSFPSQAQEKRVMEVWNFLELLRSASGNDFKASKNHGGSPCHAWKQKQDTEEYRVMYCQETLGSPFHTLLVEGCAEAPVDVCLCVGWEVSMYKKWWPKIKFPPFKVMVSSCLKKVRIDEHISQIRMKVPWPLSDREIVLEYFEIEYVDDGLVIVLLNSVTDTESLHKYMQAFTGDQVPNANDTTIRMDFTGGFAIKKITPNISYFRTVGNLDLKLDFVPPSLINFISRQLLGSATELFQKTVAAVAKGNGEFGKALEDPLYARVRENLYQENQLNNTTASQSL